MNEIVAYANGSLVEGISNFDAVLTQGSALY